MKNRNLRPETIVAHLGEDRAAHHGAVVPPLYQNSLFTFESAEAIDEAFENFNESYIYTRGNNPTVEILEKKIAALEGGERAKMFTSGMAAISASIMHFINSGDHIICVKSVYGPANNFITKYLGEKFNVSATFVEGDDIEEIENAIQENTKVIYLESPSSGVFVIQNLEAIAKQAKAHDITTMIDNTWATPVYQQPIKYGIDVVIHSASKYLSGHSDVVAGVVISNKTIIEGLFNHEHNFIGGKIAPFEAWLILRGLRTLHIRMERHSKSAKEVVDFLVKHPKVKKVNYPGLETFGQYDLACKQMSGFSGLLSFEVDTDLDGAKRILNALEIFKIGVSWGGYESLAYAPIISLAKELPEEKWKAAGIRPGLIRISVGLENPLDLIDDLNFALQCI